MGGGRGRGKKGREAHTELLVEEKTVFQRNMAHVSSRQVTWSFLHAQINISPALCATQRRDLLSSSVVACAASPSAYFLKMSRGQLNEF